MRAFLISFLICLLAALALRFTLQGIAPGVLPFEGFMFVIAGGAAALWPERLLHKIPIGENAAARLAWLLFAAILILAILPVSPVRTLWSPALPLPTWLITLLLTGLIALFLRMVASFPNLLLVRLFEAPPMIWLGSISYALYVFHVPVALIMAKALDRCACAQGWLFPLTLAVSAVLSHLSREFVERPMAKLKAGRRIAPAQPSGQLP
jgi:peptidoglycan/LPS O-acetylase OafA/YrhL